MAYMHLVSSAQLCNLRIKLNTATLTSYFTMILMQYLLFITQPPKIQLCKVATAPKGMHCCNVNTVTCIKLVVCMMSNSHRV